MGRIVAEVCLLYGWTQEYVLFHLSWEQVLLYHDRGMEYDLGRRGIAVKREEDPEDDNDEDVPDVEKIETKLGDLIRR